MICRSFYAFSVAFIVFLAGLDPAGAETFPMPSAGEDLIGSIKHARARQEDTLIDIARRYSVGQDEMVMANQDIDRWLPKAGTEVLIPQEFILPDAPRAGIIVNIPEMRLYYFPVKARPVPVKKPAVTATKKAVTLPCEAPLASIRTLKQAPPKPASSQAQKTKAQGGKPPVSSSGKAASTPASQGSKSQSKSTKTQVASNSAKKSQTSKPCQPSVQSRKAEAPKPSVVEAPDFEPPSGAEVISFPVSMGRMDWRTPLGMTRVVDKQKDPSWTPPASIKREHAAKGDPLPDVVPPGPDNPLGKYAMRLGVSGYLIHGTDAAKADGIGMRVTHGCMRMYNEDVAKLFPMVPVGAPVYLVNQPIKLGWKNGWLYMEVSQPLDEDVGIRGHDPDENVSKAQFDREDEQRAAFLLRLANTAISRLKDREELSINMDKVRKAVSKPTGIPLVIGGRTSDSSWEASAASEDGLAPKKKSAEDQETPSRETHPAEVTRYRAPKPQELLKGFDEAPVGESSSGAATESYDSAPVDDSAPVTRSPYSSKGSREPSPRPPPRSPAQTSGVKIQTYGGEDSSDFEEE